MDGWGSGQGVVTPEAVRLEFEEAGVGSRGVAILIDFLVQFAAFFILLTATAFLGTAAEGALPEWVGITIFAVLAFLILFGYPTIFETLTRGRTLGKLAMGLRVVTTEGAPIRFRHAAVRAALALVDFYMTSGAAAIIASLVSKRSQRLGDMVAGTIVMRERSAAARPTVARFEVPAGAESYASTIEPSAVRQEDYEAVRSFLLREGDLSPRVRAAVGADLARTVAARIRHVPPDGVPPELFLVCLAARYQQRGGFDPRAGVVTSPPPDPAAPSGPDVSRPQSNGDFAAPS